VGADDVMREYRDRYLDVAGHVQVDEAVELCLHLLDEGMRPEDITLQVLQPAQHEVGQRWALGSWSVAQEHAASAVTDMALAALSAAVPARPQGDPVMVACPQTEWHGLAARMVTQLLRWRGVAADHVGTLASDPALEELLTDRRPRALALSCTMTSALPGVARAVDVATRHGTAVLGGGLGFGPQGRYARAVGITACDTHVSEAARRLALWDGTGCPDHQHAVPEPIAYRRLVRHRRDIAEEIAESLLEREVDPAGAEILRDAADQVVALALAAARTGHASILDEGVVELVAVLTERPEPTSAIAARLPVAAHAVVDRYRGGP
jgi:methanogenic corrinoid protein MtbC1